MAVALLEFCYKSHTEASRAKIPLSDAMKAKARLTIGGGRDFDNGRDGGREGERRGVASQQTKVFFLVDKNRWITKTVDVLREAMVVWSRPIALHLLPQICSVSTIYIN
uniref:Uncharacterized protein n=1 Tax=Timema douglasi TaxID=61478 RepID=A0A7R8VZ23_TIMDO|nr:unnamed protein product [Timema douglasi]